MCNVKRNYILDNLLLDHFPISLPFMMPNIVVLDLSYLRCCLIINISRRSGDMILFLSMLRIHLPMFLTLTYTTLILGPITTIMRMMMTDNVWIVVKSLNVLKLFRPLYYSYHLLWLYLLFCPINNLLGMFPYLFGLLCNNHLFLFNAIRRNILL